MSLFALIGFFLFSVGCFMNKKAMMVSEEGNDDSFEIRDIGDGKKRFVPTAVTRRREINYTKRKNTTRVDLVPPPLLSASRDPRRCAFLSVHNVYSRSSRGLRAQSVAQHLCSHRSAAFVF